jgi:hypothetical protein
MVGCFWRNKLTMVRGPLPFNPLDQLAESKVTKDCVFLDLIMFLDFVDLFDSIYL